MTTQSPQSSHDRVAVASAVVGNFLSEPATPAVEEYRDYDVAAVGLGFHHFHDSALVLGRLAERVRAGGLVVILDWLPSGGRKDEGRQGQGHDHGRHGDGNGDDMQGMKHTIAHNGFDREMMGELYERVGLVDFDFVTMD